MSLRSHDLEDGTAPRLSEALLFDEQFLVDPKFSDPFN